MAKQVVGLFSNMNDAHGAVSALRNAGFGAEDISIVARNNDTTSGDGGGTEAGEGAATGATGGAVLGGLGGLLVGLGALAIPGIGPVVAAGTLATALGTAAAGAGIGAAAGGLLGALVGAGIPEEDANIYSEGVRRGGALVTVQAESDSMASQAADIMDSYNVQDIDNLGQDYRSGGWSRFDESAGEYNDGSSSGSGIGTGVGTLSGAATGAAIGSVGGPVGTVVGGVAGALTGAGVGAAGDKLGAEATDDDSGMSGGSMTDTGYTTTGTGTSGGSMTDTSYTTTGTGTSGGMTGSGLGAGIGSAIGTTSDTGTTGYTTTGTTSDTGTTGYTTTGTTGTSDYTTTGTTTGTTGNYTTTNVEGETAIPIVEEQISVGKREVEGGGVRVETNIVETPVQEQVTLRDEQVHIERRPVNQAVDPSQIDQLRTGSFEVRERDEQAVVQKEARVVEEVVIGKETHERSETIQDTVRRTDVNIEEIPGQTRTTGYTDTTTTTGTTGGMTGGTSGTTSGTTGTTGTGNEGLIEGGASRLGNAVERGTGLDLDRDGDTGQRDPRNNVGGI